MDARRVAVVVESRQAKQLVEELGRARLEEFAVMASALEIPVRRNYALEVPAAGPDGPVRIAATAIPIQLTVVDVTAFAGRLWVSMAAAVGPAAVASPRPRGLAGIAPSARSRRRASAADCIASSTSAWKPCSGAIP